MGTRTKNKPEIVNFRIKWDKVADLAVHAAGAIFTVWLMVVISIAMYVNL